MTTTDPLVDAGARDRIERSGLDETLFVEAGAGTGKTRELVERVLHLVLDAGVPLSAVAAITFTEAAAAELRDRVREALERRLAGPLDDHQRAACDTALGEVDEAAIGTLHGFALRILGEHPLEVGLPPRVDILDEVSSQLAFQARWERFLDELFTDPTAEELILRAWALNVAIEGSRHRQTIADVAAVFEDSWDRLDPVADAPLTDLPPIDLSGLQTAADELRAVRRACCAPGDKLEQRIDEVLTSVDEVLAEPEPSRRLRLVFQRHGRWKASGLGTKKSHHEVDECRRRADAVGEAGAAVCASASEDVLRRFAIRLARFTRDAAEARRAEGQLVFHDLLVLARRLVRHRAVARATLHDRYQRLLLDEFQDTDPIQIEVAVLIAAAIEGGEIERPWHEVVAESGRLFFVGDPKQSIYRFRRADIGLFLAARDAFAGERPVTLTQNFRTVDPVVAWVNHVFGGLMAEDVPGAQARYQPLTANRTDERGDHRVVLLGERMEGAKAGELRQAEAAAVADAVARVGEDPAAWPVLDTGTEEWRPARYSDVTILVPTRTSLHQLEDALDEERIPYRVATGTLVYDTQEVRDALEALKAIDDPTDEIALVSALRSPLYACSDVDLFTYHQAGGRWNLRRTPPESLPADHPVVTGLAHLRSLWLDRWWHEPSALLERLLRDRQAFALAFSHRRPREVWRRLRFLVDQARAFEEAQGGGLRPFLDWAELQRNEGSRVHEPLQTETDDDAVSILTIHGAKGLEFPITVLSGMTTEVRHGRSGVAVHWDGDRPEIRLSSAVTTAHFDRLADHEAEMDVHERTRLLYVACTRARDHLIVSTFHSAKRSYGTILAEQTAPVADTLCRRLPERPEAPPAPEAPTVPAPADDDRAAWVTRRRALLEAQSRPRFLAATAVAEKAAEADVELDDDDRPGIPRRRGRAGTAIGRAVHGVLELRRDEDGDDRLAELATQRAALEAVPEHAATVAALARSALSAEVVEAAHSAERRWRELYVAAPVGRRAVEGYIDLLYEAPEGLVIVDYKTDMVAGPADLEAKVDRYGLQLAAYAVALEVSTGMTVAGAHLVFCTTGAPVERAIEDFDELKERVRAELIEAHGPSASSSGGR
jgi:ATP-dependent helicase/nuclease subunit A